MTQLSLDQAKVTSGTETLLGPITLDLNFSGITAILGPNGAGKSLFLALIHGTIASDKGTVLWSGETATTNRASRGYMLQNSVILRRTVRANIDFALQSRGFKNRERGVKIDAALEQAQLTDRADAPAASLSGGELRRMNLARALVTSPKVLLLDEPFAGLDPAASTAMETIITEVGKSTAIFMAHHDLVQTRRMSSYVLFFTNGQLRENAFAPAFFSEPKSNEAQQFLQGQLL